MGKEIIVLMSLLIFVPLVSAEKVLSVYLVIYRNDSAELQDLKVVNGYPSRFHIPEGDYLLEITDSRGNRLYNKSMAVDYVLMTDPPVPVNYSVIDLNVPYNAEMRHIRLFNKDKQVCSDEIVVCNGDAVCDLKYETYLSCPQDCPLDKPDAICIKNKDGVCDPDCGKDVDPDCLPGSSLPVSEKRSADFDVPGFFPYALAVVLLVTACFVCLRKLEGSRLAKRRSD